MSEKKIKPIIFSSGAGNVLIKNRLTHFQNALYKDDYLDPTKNHSIIPRQLMIELNFKNPICPVNNSFPSLICVPYVHLVNSTLETDFTNYEFRLETFYNIHKYYIKPSKRYTIEGLFSEWSEREELAVNTRKRYNEELNVYENDEFLIATTRFLKNTRNSVIFGQHAVEENYQIPETEKIVLFFHFKFAKKLKIEDQMDGISHINEEKYYMLMPRSGVGSVQKSIEISHDHKGLLFKIPHIIQVQCANISSYPFDADYCKTIATINVTDEDNYSSLHYTFKGNNFFHLENKLNKNFEILLTDERNKKLRLYDGTPTILAVDVIEDEMEDQQPIMCSSRITEIHPENTPTEFTSILATPLNIDSEWKVALTGIIFKNDFKYDSTYNFQFTYEQYDHDEVLQFTRTVKIGSQVKSVQEIFETLDWALKEHVEEDIEKSGNNGRQIGSVLVSREGILTIYFSMATRISFTPHLAMILGVINSTFESTTINYNEESINYEIGFVTPINPTPTGGTFMGSTPIDFDFDLDQKFCFIEADIITEVAVGSGFGNVLKIISLSNEKKGEFVKKDFDILDWHTLKSHYIQNINFKLLAQSGSLLKMRDTSAADYSISWIQLLFKKFPKNYLL